MHWNTRRKKRNDAGGRKKKIGVDRKKRGKTMWIEDFNSKGEMVRIVWSESDKGRREE